MMPRPSPTHTQSNSRIESLDLFRGVFLFILIAADYLSFYTFVPDWFKHSKLFGTISIIDLGAPLFIFAVGISLGLVFLRCATGEEIAAASSRYVRRGLVLIAFGVIGSVIQHKGIVRDWEIFQTIGLAGIVALPFITLPPRTRIAAAVLLMLTFQAIGRYEYGDWLRHADVGGLGGILGGLAWAGLILVGSTVSAPLRSDPKKTRAVLVTMGLAALVVSALIMPFQPFDKRLATLSYLALTTGLAAFALLACIAVTRKTRVRLLPFTILGSNALVTFIVHGIGLLALTTLIPASSPMRTVLPALAVLYASCYASAGWLYLHRMFVRL